MSMLLLLSLVAAGEQPVDSFTDVSAWSLNQDGGSGASCQAETTLVASPPGAMRVAYDASGPSQWGNLLRQVTVPPNAIALTFKLYLLKAEPGAAMHLWFLEADGDGYLTRMEYQGKGLTEAPRDQWLDVRIPMGALRFDPRGNKERKFLSINRMLLGHNYAPLEYVIDDLGFELGTIRDAAPLPTSANWQLKPGERGAVVLLDEPGLPRTDGAADAKAVAAALTKAGFGVTTARAGDLAEPTRLNRDNVDLLLLPTAPGFPVAAHDNLKRFLKSGGAVLSLGGYAFDQPVDWTGEKWVPQATEILASEMDQGLVKARINTRYGKPGDTMQLNPEQIGLFDPSDRYEHVTKVAWGGKSLDTDLSGYVARSMAGSNSPVFPDQHGETEFFGQSYDRLGRPRGALGVIAQFYDGPYKGGAWGGVGIESRDLFAPDALGSGPVIELADRLCSGLYLHSLQADKACVRNGEEVTISAVLANRGRRPAEVESSLAIREGEETSSKVTLRPGDGQLMRLLWKPREYLSDLYHLDATMAVDGKPVMARESAFCAWQPAVVASGPKVSWKDNYLQLNGHPAYLTGTNQTGVMWHSPRENPLTWDRDFEQMHDRGMVVWRVLHFSPFAGRDGVRPRENPLLLGETPPDKLVRQTDAMVMLAQKHGLVFMPCAHDWIGTELPDDQLEAQRKWNRFWAERYKDVPGLLWDIQNEPSVRIPHPAPWHLNHLWEQYLTERYGDLAKARQALGLAADATLTPHGGNDWNDPVTVEVEWYRTWLLNRWVQVNVEGLREGDPDAVITVGYLQNRSSADKVNGVKYLDFSNMHSYESPRTFLSSIRFIDHRAIGKGFSLGEYGQRQSHDARVNGQTGEQAELDRARFTTQVGQVYAGGGAFAANWCWRDLPDVIFPWGLTTPDRRPRPWAADLLAMTLVTAAFEPVYQPPQLYVLLPDRARLGARFGDIDRAVQRCLDTLDGLSVPYAVLNEGLLEQFPAEAKAVIWPLPYCPTEQTFETVLSWVAKGGQLWFSGGIGFDELRRPTRSERWRALGLEPQPAREPFVPAGAADAVTAKVGRGLVSWVGAPLELIDQDLVRTRYSQFVQQSGMSQLAVTPSDHDVPSQLVHGRDGSTAWVVASWGADREVTLSDAQTVTVQVAADFLGIVQRSADGKLFGMLAQGPVACDGPAVLAAPHFALLSADGADVRESGSLALLPLTSGEFRLQTRRTWRKPTAQVLESVGGGLKECGTLPVTVRDGVLSLTLDDALPGTIVLVSEAGQTGPVADEILKALHHVR